MIAAWNLQWSRLKQDLVPICLFAIVGVLISVAGIALGLNQFVGLSLPTALLIGVCLSATDPVSVVALFRGENLFNDGMAIVAFSFLLSFALGTAHFQVQSILIQFFARNLHHCY